jgi:hypothetical protein
MQDTWHLPGFHPIGINSDVGRCDMDPVVPRTSRTVSILKQTVNQYLEELSLIVPSVNGVGVTAWIRHELPAINRKWYERQ